MIILVILNAVKIVYMKKDFPAKWFFEGDISLQTIEIDSYKKNGEFSF